MAIIEKLEAYNFQDPNNSELFEAGLSVFINLTYKSQLENQVYYDYLGICSFFYAKFIKA